MHYQVSQIPVLLPRAMGMLHPEPLVGIGYRRLVGMRYSLGGYVCITKGVPFSDQLSKQQSNALMPLME